MYTAALTGRIQFFCIPVATQNTELHCMLVKKREQSFGHLSLL